MGPRLVYIPRMAVFRKSEYARALCLSACKPMVSSARRVDVNWTDLTTFHSSPNKLHPSLSVLQLSFALSPGLIPSTFFFLLRPHPCTLLLSCIRALSSFIRFNFLLSFPASFYSSFFFPTDTYSNPFAYVRSREKAGASAGKNIPFQCVRRDSKSTECWYEFA